MSLKLQIPDSSYQFYEQNFRRMENDIKVVMDAFPAEIKFDLRGDERVAATWVHNFRTACQAFCHPECVWISHKLNRRRILEVFDSGIRFKVNNAIQQVTVQPRRLLTIKPGHSASISMPGVMDVRNKEEHLKAILLLKNSEYIHDVVCIWGLEKAQIPLLEAQYPNVAFASNADGTTNLI